MGFSKAFKITSEPRTFQAGDSTGFNLSLGAQYYDRKTKQKEWSNYSAVVFAKGNQLSFYQSSLVIGTIIELSSNDLKIDNYNPEYLTIQLIDAQLVNVFTGDAPQQQQGNQNQESQTYQQPQQQQPQYNEPPQDFSDEIPFAPIGLMHSNNLLHAI